MKESQGTGTCAVGTVLGLYVRVVLRGSVSGSVYGDELLREHS